MKYKIFILICNLYAVQLFSQQLNKNDIDIYIKGLEYIGNELEDIQYGNYIKDDEMYEYLDLLDRLHNSFMYLSINPDEIEFKNWLIDYFNNYFMNYNAPKIINDVFKNVGWSVDGHKKYWCIVFGKKCFKINNNSEIESNEMFFDIFNEIDLEIIRNRLYDIENIRKKLLGIN
jgi:hypothetical protein